MDDDKYFFHGFLHFLFIFVDLLLCMKISYSYNAKLSQHETCYLPLSSHCKPIVFSGKNEELRLCLSGVSQVIYLMI